MKKFLSIVSMLVATSMLLAACGPTTTPTPQVVVQTAVVTSVVQQTVMATSVVQQTVVVNNVITATPAPPSVTGTVRIGTWDSADSLNPLNAAIKGFEAKYPGVKVQLESVPQDYGTKLLAEVASGTAPDVFQVGDGQPSDWAGQGILEPLDDYISGKIGNNPLDMSVFYPAVAAIGKVNGHQYLLTKDTSPLILHYNKTLFDAAKVDYPTDKWTWDDLLAAAQKLTVTAGGKITQWGIELPDGWGDPSWTRGIAPLVYQNGGALLSPDGKTTTGFLNSDATVAALQWYFDLFSKYKVAPTAADVAALSGQDLFATGKVAMMWSGIWGIRGYMANSKLNFGVAQLPMGKQRGNSICWAGYAMYSKGTNKVAAWAFLKWMGAEGGAQELAKAALTDVVSIADLQGLTKDPYFGPVMSDLANVVPLEILRNAKYNDCVDTPLHDAIAAYALKGGDLKAILTGVATTADACLAK
jgi:multiple sugar transport system substrate-binding protein